jgi:hypothetical protein
MVGRPGDQRGASDLPTLASSEKITPKEDWVYRERILTEDLSIFGVKGTTPVLQDELQNSYSSMDMPFDQSLCRCRFRGRYEFRVLLAVWAGRS